jgi:uncharacterized protein YutE (UPF0331/DUF86 family)
VTDRDLIAKRLALVETYVRELRELARPDRMAHDLRELRFVERTLQLAVQAALDTASHIVSDSHLGEPLTNQDLFLLLARNGWIGDDLASRMAAAAGFRNVLVHGYAAIDVAIVRDIVEHRLDDLLAFVKAVRGRI